LSSLVRSGTSGVPPNGTFVPTAQKPGRSAIPARFRTHRIRRRPHSKSGQSLVEFALVFPIFFVLLLAIIEFAFALNALVSIDFATRDAALAAAEAGNADEADCSILRALDGSMTAPANNSRVTEVRIFKSDVNGVALGPVNVYDRTGATSCPLEDGTPATVAYQLVSGTYPESSRCNELGGCGVQPTVDTIGVQISYGYGWVTPLHVLVPSLEPGYSMVKSNAMRMEPIL
jgi:Flp pilus assembly protein TadG